jgi:glycosyltransferase involved in cell wall biosynthesis
MNGYIVGQLFETITIVALGLCFLGIIIGSFYDIWMTRQQKAIEIQTKQLRRARPHVTILVYAQNNASVIATCLTSIFKNRYRQYDIVVVNNKSTDTTKLEINRFQRTHPSAPLYVYNKRKEDTIHTALRQGYKKSQRGDIILTLKSNGVISKTFLKESVAHFMAFGASEKHRALLFNDYVLPSLDFTASLRHFPRVSRQFMRKIVSILRLGRLSVDTPILYTAMYLRLDFVSNAASTKRYIYDSKLAFHIIVLHQSFFSKKRLSKALISFYLVGFATSIYVTYSLYMAATLQNTALLFYSWLVVVVWYLAALWLDDVSKVSDKLRLSFTLPSLYFFFYLTIVIETIGGFLAGVFKGTQAIVRSVVIFYASQPPPL